MIPVHCNRHVLLALTCLSLTPKCAVLANVFPGHVIGEGLGEDQSRRVMIGDVSLSLCEYTCAAMCGSPNRPDGAPCYCDRACLLYKDCCLDFFAYCLDNDGEGTTETGMNNSENIPDENTKDDFGPPNMPQQKSNAPRNFTLGGSAPGDKGLGGDLDESLNEDIDIALQEAIKTGISSVYSSKEPPKEIETAALMDCRLVRTRSPKTDRKWKMVTKCPQLVGSNLEKWRAPCESDHSTMQQHILTLVTDIEGNFSRFLYSNPYCALCHGHLLNDTNLTMITPEFHCGNRSEEGQKIFEEEGMGQFVKYLIRRCVPLYDLPLLSERLMCPRFSYQHTCSASYPVSTLCDIYTEPKENLISREVYKNNHCALCNGDSENRTCTHHWPRYGVPGSGFGIFPSFSLLMDFSGVRTVRNKERVVCPKETYIDLAEDACVISQCEKGKVSVDGDCVGLNVSITQLLNPADMVFSFVVVADSYPDAAMVLRTLSKSFDVHVQVEGNCSLVKSQYSLWSDITQLRSNETCVHIGLNGTDQDMSLSNILQISKSLVVTAGGVSKLLFFNHRPNVANFSCRVGSSLAVRQVHLTEDSETNKVMMVANDTGVLVSFAENPTKIVLEASDKKSSSLAMFCEPSIMTCDKVLVRSGDYVKVLGQIKVSGYDKFVDAHEYIEMGSGDVFVCSSALGSGSDAEEGSAIEGILSLIGICLSMLGLVLTIATYSMFPVLRTVPGIGIMNLSVALFVAQLLFEVAPKASDNEALCTLLGALQHYSWLVAFLWMNVLAYDISCTFSNMMAKSAYQTTKSLRFRLFVAYAWCLPGVGVAVCLALNFAANVSFEYIDGDNCWIKAGAPLLYTFGVPVALIIVLNVAFFTRTALSLRAAMETAKRAKSNNDSSARYTIYIKLSSLMGFTWIFGFVAGLTNIDALFYLFIITNSVQGVYICVSFALSDRVRSLYKAKFGSEKEGIGPETVATGVDRAQDLSTKPKE